MPLQPRRIPVLSGPLLTCLVIACGDDDGGEGSFGSVSLGGSGPTMPGSATGTTGGADTGEATRTGGPTSTTAPDPTTPDPTAPDPTVQTLPGTDSGHGTTSDDGTSGTNGSSTYGSSTYGSSYGSSYYGSSYGSGYYGSSSYDGSETGMYMCYEAGYDCYGYQECCEYDCCSQQCNPMGYCQ